MLCQGLYLLLVTNKASNILEDLETLRLLSKVGMWTVCSAARVFTFIHPSATRPCSSELPLACYNIHHVTLCMGILTASVSSRSSEKLSACSGWCNLIDEAYLYEVSQRALISCCMHNYTNLDILTRMIRCTKSQAYNSSTALNQVVPEYTLGLDEDSVGRAAFDLLFAFDEVISLGYKENVTVAQVKQNTEMESHEEKLHKMIIQSKINDTKVGPCCGTKQHD